MPTYTDATQVNRIPPTPSYLSKEDSIAWISSQRVSTNGTLEIPASIDGFFDSFSSYISFKNYPIGKEIVHLKILSEKFSAGYGLFQGLVQLETVTINGLDKRIPAACFGNCKKLKTVIVKNQTPIILNDSCFRQCESLTTFAGNVKQVNCNVFSECHELQAFPFETVEEIWHHAFAFCFSLTKVKCEHPNGTKLRGVPFKNCTSLQEFYLGGTIPVNNETDKLDRSEMRHFEYCPKLKTFYLSSCRSVRFVKLISYDTLDNLYILTPETQRPPLDYWRSQSKFLQSGSAYRNVKINGDPSILKVLGLSPEKIAPLTYVRLNAEGQFIESYVPYKATPRVATFALSNQRKKDDIPRLPSELTNKIFEHEHYVLPKFVDDT